MNIVTNKFYSVSHKTIYIVLCMIIITYYKFWLADVYSLRAIYAPQDDYLFINLARNILDGNWLGEYDQYTLMKGLFYPLWIVFCNLLDIPLQTAQQLLYAFASTLFVVAINPYIKNKWWLVLIFAFMMLNPLSIAVDRVLRLGIYPALAVLVFACAFGLYSRTISIKGKHLWWSIGLGLSLAAFWHTREERIWIAPSLAMLLFFGLIQTYANNKKNILSTITVYFIPAVIVIVATLSMSYVNWKHYGIFTSLEIGTKEFKSAYSGLFRIKTDTWIKFYPVNYETMEKAYAVSPAFREISSGLKTISGDNPDTMGFGMRASHFIWSFRDSVQWAGYYNFDGSDNPKSVKETLEFYDRMGQELNQACETGEIECAILLNPLFPQWRKEDNEKVLPTFYHTIKRLITFDGFNYKVNDLRSEPSYRGLKGFETLLLFESVTNERLRHHKSNANKLIPEFEKERIQYKRTTVRNIWKNVYQRFSPVLFIIFSIFVVVKMFYEIFKLKPHVLTVFSASLLAGILSHSMIMTLIQINAFTEVLVRSQFTMYPVLLMFIVSGFLVAGLMVDSRKNSDTNSD